MTKRRIEEKVEQLAVPIIEENDCVLVDIEYVKEGPNWYLRVYIDKYNGVTVDDCERVSEHLSNLLDREDPIDHSYILEVSSPGVDRPLKTQRDYEYFTGHEVDVKLYSPMDEKKEYRGILMGLKDGIVTLDAPEGKLHFRKESIASARLTFKF
ncbi:MAG: ribosome maturation factor RimP [Bacillota bacterium]|nr:ribosome maturation factor RimP [Bacillota bacterium]MDD3297296.1 ribosome maturation factor RimP [Bacillota bacterium]MDD3850797.1 ribosome maturation factor RimP [Bacillota bacterium]MDD4706812.1 ribosome maturation factor RimP [Bacillota bacterium]